MPAVEETETKVQAMEEPQAKAGSSAALEGEARDQALKDISTLKEKGLTAVTNKDYFGAADAFSMASELTSKIYGELAPECGDIYFLYGSVLVECGKVENTVVGEKVPNDEGEDDVEVEDDKETENSEAKVENGEAKVENGDAKTENGEVKVENGEAKTENGEAEVKNGEDKVETEENEANEKKDEDQNDDEKKDEDQSADETIGDKEDDTDDESSLKMAWEMLEMAKVIFEKTNYEKGISDCLFRLGEVGIELGHKTAVDDMKKSLEIRKKLFPDSRIIPETHFHIGLALGLFEEFDDAIEHLHLARKILAEKLESLAKDETKANEAKQIQELLPDLDDKIKDMKESKNAKVIAAEQEASSSKANGEKPAANITHLVKRKRKLDEVASDLMPDKAPKQSCLDPDSASEAKAKMEVDEVQPNEAKEQVSSTDDKKEETSKVPEVVDSEVSNSEENKTEGEATASMNCEENSEVTTSEDTAKTVDESVAKSEVTTSCQNEAEKVEETN